MTEPVRQLGRYELLKRIAKGGMGEIWLARARGTAGFEKTCILKTILPHLAEEEEFVTKFLDEGHIVVQLVHGNIVPVFDMGEEDGEYYLAMEYIPGRDLREVTKRLGAEDEAVPVDLALFITSEVCKGLDYAHRKTDESGESLGIIHRDVSPSNILISREGEVKLIDFGIARAAGRLGKTVSGRIQGKFCYMSPEQAGGKKLDGRSDIFSAGVVLYEMLTAFRPFEGDTDLESLDLVRQCQFDPPSTLNPEIPPEVDAIIERALAKDPDDRYQTIDQLQLECLQYLYTAGTAPTPSELADFLAGVFPEGLERKELKSARDSGSKDPPGKMNLDEALDFELGKLMEGSGADESVDPLETTAVSSDQYHQKVLGETRTGAAPTPAGSASTVREVPGPEEPEPVDSVSTGPVEPAGPKRSVGIIVALLLVVLAGGGLVVYGTMTPDRGRAVVRSDPAGAQILVDGAHEGVQTPHTLTLTPGRHEIRLELEGYEPRVLPVKVKVDEKTQLPIARLRPVTKEEGPREIELTVSPDDAVISVDGARLGTGEAVLVLAPGEEKRVAFDHEGCTSIKHVVNYAMRKDEVDVELTCDGTPAADAGTQEEVAADTEGRPAEKTRRVRLTIRSDPDGATIYADEKRLGAAPVSWTGPASETVRFRAEKKGFETVDVRRRVGSVRGKSLKLKLKPSAQGCLNLRLMNPWVARVAIDGEWIGKKDRLANYKLSVGEHTVRIKNDEAKITDDKVGIDHTAKVEIEPGSRCTLLVVNGKKL